MNVYSRGFRNAFRNVTRSISIIIILGLAIGLSLVMLIAHQAVSNKINSVNSSIGNTVTITPAGYNGFSTVNNSLTSAELSKVSNLDHVTSINETLTDRLTTIGSASFSFGQNASTSNNQTSLTSPVKLNFDRPAGGGGLFVSGGGSAPTNFSLPVTIIGTNDPSSINGNSLTISSGSSISGTAENNDAMVSTAMASKNNLKVGSTFTAYGDTLNVVGIYKAESTSPLSGEIVVSLPTEQKLSGQTGDITNAVVTVDSLDNLSSTTTEIKNTLGSSADVTSSVQQAQATTQPLNNIKTISLYSLIGAVIAGIVITFLIMIMIVRERRREIGVLKAIGASNLKVAIQFMSEAVTLTLAGAVVGILIGVAAASPITHLLVTSASSSSNSASGFTRPGGPGGGGSAFNGGNFALRDNAHGSFRGVRNSFSNIQAVVGWTIVLDGIGAALVIAIIGSGASSLLISKVRPADVMRVE